MPRFLKWFLGQCAMATMAGAILLPACWAEPASAPAVVGDNLQLDSFVTNGSFEMPLAGPSLESDIPGWSFGFQPQENHPPLTKDEVQIIDDPAQALEGKRFLRLRPSERLFSVRTPQRDDFPPGLYEVSVWARGRGVNAGLGLSVLGANFGAGLYKLEDTWKKYSMRTWCPGVGRKYTGKDLPWRDQTQFSLTLKAGGPDGAVVDIDNVSVIRLAVGLADTFGDHMVLQRERPVPIWGWAKSAGQEVKVDFNGQSAVTTAGKDGRWQVLLKPMKPGGPYVLSLNGRPTLFDVLVGDVWVCSGQSNMEMGIDKLNGIYGTAPEVTDKANHPQLRLWQAAKQISEKPSQSYQLRQDSGNDPFQATWLVCTPDTVRRGIWGGFSAAGYFFGRDIQATQKVPVGLMMIANGGTPIESFISAPALQKIPSAQWVVPPVGQAKPANLKIAPMPKAPPGIEDSTDAYKDVAARVFDHEAARGGSSAEAFQQASAVYNGLVAPVFPMAVRGVVWYQGEHNGGDAFYEAKLKCLMADWRSGFNAPQLPFIIAQLPFWRTDSGAKWQLVREAQWHVAQKDPNAALAVTLDLNDKEGDMYGMGEIHPKNKRDVGQRMALAARKLVYGEKIVASGPIFREWKISDGKITLTFDSTGTGLEVRGDKLTGFRVAGTDRKFVEAQGAIVGNTVQLTIPNGTEPVAVRYGFAQAMLPVPNLYNKEGLPAAPFRTDDWPVE